MRQTKRIPLLALAVCISSSVAAAQNGQCPEPNNHIMTCTGHDCQGRVEVGYCDPAYPDGYQCETHEIGCCGKNYNFAETNGECLDALGFFCARPRFGAFQDGASAVEKRKGPVRFSRSTPARSEARAAGRTSKAHEPAAARRSGGGVL